MERNIRIDKKITWYLARSWSLLNEWENISGIWRLELEISSFGKESSIVCIYLKKFQEKDKIDLIKWYFIYKNVTKRMGCKKCDLLTIYFLFKNRKSFFFYIRTIYLTWFRLPSYHKNYGFSLWLWFAAFFFTFSAKIQFWQCSRLELLLGNQYDGKIS